jgi:CIC family chloride channel protein
MKKSSTTAALREKLQTRLATLDQLGHLSLLGALVGVLAGMVIAAFRFAVESAQGYFLPGGKPENYEDLPRWLCFVLPALGGVLIGVLFQAAKPQQRSVGVIHVMERLAYHQAKLPAVNAMMQFIGATISIVFGHSVGREGPAVHLGAATGSCLGQWLRLPNNSNRTLVACGVAAAIAAAFNTPLAGVIFSMEVVLMEYTLAGFLPVILAAVSATSVIRLVFGAEPAFKVPPLELGTLNELPHVLILGFVIGCVAALFIYALIFFSGVAQKRALWQRTTAAGCVVGVCALVVPAVMGLGYDTVEDTMLGGMGLALLLSIAAGKLLATAVSVGLGLPGGLIGPTLVIGATAGAAIGQLAGLLPQSVSSPALYAMLGMGAMMGATLQAPLAALTALLELTANPNIILPGMLAVAVASLTSSLLFGKSSIFLLLMRARGLDYQDHPVAQSLRRASVAKVMDRAFALCPLHMSGEQADATLRGNPRWIVVRDDKGFSFVMPANELAAYLGGQALPSTIHLGEIPAQRRQALTIDVRATQQEALEMLRRETAEALVVVDQRRAESDRLFGVLTREDIEHGYRYAAPRKSQAR